MANLDVQQRCNSSSSSTVALNTDTSGIRHHITHSTRHKPSPHNLTFGNNEEGKVYYSGVQETWARINGSCRMIIDPVTKQNTKSLFLEPNVTPSKCTFQNPSCRSSIESISNKACSIYCSRAWRTLGGYFRREFECLAYIPRSSNAERIEMD